MYLTYYLGIKKNIFDMFSRIPNLQIFSCVLQIVLFFVKIDFFFDLSRRILRCFERKSLPVQNCQQKSLGKYIVLTLGMQQTHEVRAVGGQHTI